MATCTRRIEFDAAHRVMRHESKCRNLHGHRYRADITASASLDSLGRVIDFSVLKTVIGGWVDEHWDHGTIINPDDVHLHKYCLDNDSKVYLLGDGENPTAEVMAEHLLHMANRLLEKASSHVIVTHLRLYETPNCWADVRLGGELPRL